MNQPVRFSPERAKTFQDGKIRAHALVPEGATVPFTLDAVELSSTTDVEVHKINKLFTVLAGKGTLTLGDEVLELGAGDMVWIDYEVPHSWVIQEAPLRLTVAKWA